VVLSREAFSAKRSRTKVRCPTEATTYGLRAIESNIAKSGQDVPLVGGAMALALLELLFAAFSGASRLLARQNRQWRRSEERFRSLVQNSVDLNMVVRADGSIACESPAAERLLGLLVKERVGQPALQMVQRRIPTSGSAWWRMS